MNDGTDLDDDRYATLRGRYLTRSTELREDPAKAVAYSERGYSFSAIADKLNTGDSTVKDWMERAMARYGFELLEAAVPRGEEAPDHDIVEPGYHRSRHPQDQQKWVDMIARHKNQLPIEWANDALEEAKADSVAPTIEL